MSYLRDVERLLTELESIHAVRSKRTAEFVRADSFEISITVFEPEPRRERKFDLSAGLTPGVTVAVRKWFEAIIIPENARTEVTTEDAPVGIEPSTHSSRRYSIALPPGISLRR